MKQTQSEQVILEKTEDFVKSKLAGDTTGHDWWHIERVRTLAVSLAAAEKANRFICEMAALLHDVIDDKLVADEAVATGEVVAWLVEQQVNASDSAEILAIIQDMSFKGGANEGKVLSLEGQVVQDADRLDAIGAIGIARTMIYTGAKGRPMHLPEKQPRERLTLEQYRNGEDTAIMHFYEKLLSLKSLMNTPSAQMKAAQRHAFLEEYLTQFFAEWQGER
ncbi:HD domain-containing protein [Brochothrix campestris]|uniref:Metal-dependent phosphohydrolase n=1 Tax=Brochothrix campestris FSL F6-1037 TaxID=1265861 RepID=W7CCA6_9LIST|nr:HD domain-containing protein [Brochothrix campestris]EUJ36969.1 metal-dependent phosphohydrolase [Brochothrix campestris FSL F6-1037]